MHVEALRRLNCISRVDRELTDTSCTSSEMPRVHRGDAEGAARPVLERGLHRDGASYGDLTIISPTIISNKH